MSGFLEVGTNGKGEVVVNHPEMKPDANGVGRIIFSPRQARDLAEVLVAKAGEADAEKPEPPPVDRAKRTLTDGSPVTDDHREIDPETGMQKGYVVLSEEERAKGFVRPVRRVYEHITCGYATTMSIPLAETYARDPKFYDGTFCATCRKHFPVNEFHWLGTDEIVGS